MKNTIKLVVFFITLFAFLLLNQNFSNASTPVTDEESLNNAVSSADYGATITLQNDITVTNPIVIAKELIIDGNGHTITGSSEWTSTSGNQTMFTAQFSDAKLTLKNIKLKNGPKYGVQSYDGATVILDNVSITGFNYGGVLANGGNIEVRNLHLGYNGTGANNGIEIDKGASATNNPSLVMNGVLTSDSAENIVRPAENGHLTEFTVTNTPNTTNKVVITSDKVVLTDASDNVLSETTIPGQITANTDVKKVIVTLIANNKTNKITVDSGKTITEDLLKTHITLEENYLIDGFYTDANFSTKFNFNDPLNTDTTIYAKISKIETPAPEEQPETTVPEKDETPKTGVDNYLGLATLTLLISGIAIFSMKKMLNKD